MSEQQPFSIEGVPSQNYSNGLLDISVPRLGEPQRGKVRNSWQDAGQRIMVTTDRLSAYDRAICTIPGKGMVLNMLSAYWFNETKHTVPNHVIAIPHPNVVVAEQAQATLPVEMVVRGHMAKSSTGTSVFDNYVRQGKRNIYGIDFPEGLLANQAFPPEVGRNGMVITPTTKAEQGHDEMLTLEEARELVNREFGVGMWEAAEEGAYQLFESGRKRSRESGLILADTKYEFGIDGEGKIMLIDEVHTPDSSRFWKAETYEQRLAEGVSPENFDKELVRRDLVETHHFTGDGMVPVIDSALIGGVAEAYTVPYTMLTGERLPTTYVDAAGEQWDAADPEGIQAAIGYWLNDCAVGSWK